jgi:hypothetical protein
MSGIQQLEGRPCYESDIDEYGMIEVRTCMDGTEEVCCLSQGEIGTQRTGITNWRSHVSTVEIRIRSLNEGITLITGEEDTQESYEYTEKAHVAPSKGSNVNEHRFQVRARKESGDTLASEIIQVSMTIDTEQAAENSREGPTLHSEIRFK